jgi:hypothetical protein
VMPPRVELLHRTLGFCDDAVLLLSTKHVMLRFVNNMKLNREKTITHCVFKLPYSVQSIFHRQVRIFHQQELMITQIYHKKQILLYLDVNSIKIKRV